MIAEGGWVNAEARCSEMTVGGIFEGQAEVAKALIILSTGNCSGEVTCKDLVMEAGGKLNAKVTCRSSTS